MERGGAYGGRRGGGRGRGSWDGGRGGERGSGGRERGGRGGRVHHHQNPQAWSQGRVRSQSGGTQMPDRELGPGQGARSPWDSAGEGSSRGSEAWKSTSRGHVGPTTGSPAPAPAPAPARITPSDSHTDDLVPRMQSLGTSLQSSSPSCPAEIAGRLTPLRRPDNGGTIAVRACRIRVNHFPVMFDPDRVIMHYDVDVKPEIPPKNNRPEKITKSDLFMIRDKLFSDEPTQFPLSMTVYDGVKNIFSAVALPTGKYTVTVNKGEDTKDRSFIFTIKHVNTLKLSKLTDYLSGLLLSIPRDILQAFDLVMKENPSKKMIPVGRYFFSRESMRDDDLGYGVTALRGSQHGLKTTCQGLALCLDYSVLPFYEEISVLDFIMKKLEDIKDFGKFRRQIEEDLKGLRVTVTHRKTKQKYTIARLTEKNARHHSFPLHDPEGKLKPRDALIVDYFWEKYRKKIKYLDIPCLDLGKNNKKNDVPMEFCILTEGQRYPKELDKYGADKLKRMSLAQPRDRQNMICSMIRSESGPCGGGIIQGFRVEVNMNMTVVSGRVINPPLLKIGAPNGRETRITVDRDKCHWNLVGKSVFKGKSVDRWGVIDFTGDRRFDVNGFVSKLINRCRNLGILMQEPLGLEYATMRIFDRTNELNQLLKSINEDGRKRGGGDLQMLLCVMSEKHPGYEHLKWISETKVGVMTQCCLSSHAKKPDKYLDQYLANLALKINAKIGGSNVELNDKLPHFEVNDHVMFVGADVNHPGSGLTPSPSIAAVVATVNWPAANRYAARVRPQDPRTEKILNFGDLCLDLVDSFTRINKVRPTKIIVFRDGVSEGQFDMVLNEELLDLKRAFKSINYSPSITLIVAQKRHLTRLFPEDQTGNVPPGTVVDTTIVHHFEFDFYLCSHSGSLGTSKPTHYYVLYDEHKFTSDELQKLIYDMCFTFARCTKPVSLVPPVYYADLVAYRGRLYYKAMMVEFSKGSSSSSATPLLSPASLESYFRSHADLENTMFFV